MALNFFPNSGTVVNDALADIGAWDPEGSSEPTTSQRTTGLQQLNYLVTAWQAHGMQVWCQKRGSYTLSDGVDDPTIGPSGADITAARPLSIQQAWLRDDDTDPDTDIPLRIISREEYNGISNKLADGTPNCVFYDPEYDVPGSNSGANAKGRLYMWPVPDATVAARYTLYFIYTRPLQDFSGLTDTLDFPQEWFNAVRWNLALSLCPSYEVPLGKMDRIKVLAKESLELAMSWDRELTSAFISPASK
jgi:hypothetical protein